MKVTRVIVAIAIAMVTTACYQLDQEIHLNPDGRGKIEIDVTKDDPAASMSMSLGQELGVKTSPVEAAATLAYDILTKSTGISAWSNISYQMTEDGRIRFKGTAYFENLSEVALHEMDMVRFAVTKGAKGRMILSASVNSSPDASMQKDETPRVDTSSLTSADVKRLIAQHRQEYRYMRSMMAMVVGSVEVSTRVRLPGPLSEIRGAKSAGEGSVEISFQGSRFLDALDRLVDSDTLLENQIRATGSAKEQTPEMRRILDSSVFGETEPVRVAAGPVLKPRFDYDAEVAAAADDLAGILAMIEAEKGAGSTAPSGPVELAEGDAISELRVGGLTMIFEPENSNNLAPFYKQGPMMEISLIGRLPFPIDGASEGRLARITSVSGEDLMPLADWSRSIADVQISADGEWVVFTVQARLPEDTSSDIGGIEGTVGVWLAEGEAQIPFRYMGQQTPPRKPGSWKE